MDEDNSNGSIGDVPSDTMPNEGERRKHNYYRVKEALEGPTREYSFIMVQSLMHIVDANVDVEVPSIHLPLGRVFLINL